MRASPWASLVCIPVLFMTLGTYFDYNVLWGCGSIFGFPRDFMNCVQHAMNSAGASTILAVMIWRRAAAWSRRVLEVCVIANLYALFVVTQQRLDDVDCRFFDRMRHQTYDVMRWVALEAYAVAAFRQVDVGSCVEEVLAGVRDAWGRRLWVIATEPSAGFREVVFLGSSGADGVAGTQDDIRLRTPR